MKYQLLITAFSLISTLCFGQQTLQKTMQHDGATRNYTLYIPTTYNTNSPTELVLNLHGYGSNETQQLYYGDFRAIADTAGFILVLPKGLTDGNGSTHWNSGWGSGVDDLGFLSALIDEVSSNYSINPNKVFSTGMSNGGFMSYYLACNLSDKIAAIASVTGSMNNGQVNSCPVTHPMPVMEIHGNNDPTVPYNGNTNFASTPATVDFWINHNNCDTAAIFNSLPDINTNDNSTVESYTYKNGTNGSEVVHYKILNGEHDWPGAFLGGANQDLEASIVIWEFFNRFDKSVLEGNTISNITSSTQKDDFNITSQLPFTDYLTIKSNYTTPQTIIIYNELGQAVITKKILKNETINLNFNQLPNGMYFLKASDFTRKVIKI